MIDERARATKIIAVVVVLSEQEGLEDTRVNFPAVVCVRMNNQGEFQVYT